MSDPTRLNRPGYTWVLIIALKKSLEHVNPHCDHPLTSLHVDEDAGIFGCVKCLTNVGPDLVRTAMGGTP